MKATFRIATEQFCFAEVSTEIPDDARADQIRGQYEMLRDAFKEQTETELPTKEWNPFIERIMLGEPNHIEMWEKCSPEQKKTLNEIKKALNRIEARNKPKELRDRLNEE